MRDAMIFYATLHYEKDGHLEFVQSVTGVRTLKDEFEKTARRYAFRNARRSALIVAASVVGMPCGKPL